MQPAHLRSGHRKNVRASTGARLTPAVAARGAEDIRAQYPVEARSPRKVIEPWHVAHLESERPRLMVMPYVGGLGPFLMLASRALRFGQLLSHPALRLLGGARPCVGGAARSRAGGRMSASCSPPRSSSLRSHVAAMAMLLAGEPNEPRASRAGLRIAQRVPNPVETIVRRRAFCLRRARRLLGYRDVDPLFPVPFRRKPEAQARRVRRRRPSRARESNASHCL